MCPEQHRFAHPGLQEEVCYSRLPVLLCSHRRAVRKRQKNVWRAGQWEQSWVELYLTVLYRPVLTLWVICLFVEYFVTLNNSQDKMVGSEEYVRLNLIVSSPCRWQTIFPSWHASVQTCGPSPCAQSTDRGILTTCRRTYRGWFLHQKLCSKCIFHKWLSDMRKWGCGKSQTYHYVDLERFSISSDSEKLLTYTLRVWRYKNGSAVIHLCLSQAHCRRHQSSLLSAVLREAAEIRHRRSRPRHRVRTSLHRQRAQRPALQQALPERGRWGIGHFTPSHGAQVHALSVRGAIHVAWFPWRHDKLLRSIAG